MELLDLNWEDVLHRQVMSRLSLSDLFQLRAVSTGCRDLVHSYFSNLLKLDVCPYAGDLSRDAFKVVASNTGGLQSFKGDHCTFLDDESMKILFCKNRNIKSVSLQGCINLSPACLHPLILHCKGLKVLNLSGCPWLTPGCLEVFALHQSNLEEVHFDSSPCLDDSCLEHFFSTFQQMQVVHFAHLHSVTDRTLEALAKHCRGLRKLDFSNCSQITDKGLIAVGQCPDLEVLRVAYCASVGSSACNVLAARFDHTHISDERPRPPPGWCILRMPMNPGWIFRRRKLVEA